MATFEIHHGDALDVLRGMADNSVDAVVTDPPYGLGKEPDAAEVLRDWVTKGFHEVKASGGFMGKAWDSFVPQPLLWKEVFRVLKPGGHLLSLAGTRTYDWMVMSVRLAGFEIRDMVNWVYGSGFPKSLDVSKAIDKMHGAEREIVGSYKATETARTMTGGNYGGGGNNQSERDQIYQTAPATEAAKQWDGWGTALKPAHEPIVLARKPLSESNIAANVLRWRTGAVNVDGCRIKTSDNLSGGTYGGVFSASRNPDGTLCKAIGSGDKGRFPANLIHDGSAEVVGMFPKSKDGVAERRTGQNGVGNWGYAAQSEKWGGYNGEGSAARFFKACPPDAASLFYCAKASRSERDAGLDGMDAKPIRESGAGFGKMSMWNGENGDDEWKAKNPNNPARNHHPTVKPQSLMRYLCRLITPPNGIILDPFFGSGSTGAAALAEGFSIIGIEQDAEFVEIARRRCEHAKEVKPKPEQRQVSLLEICAENAA